MPGKQNYPDRRQFFLKMCRIHENDTVDTVEAVLGKPDDIWQDQEPLPFPEKDVLWCYGSTGHLSLPTLGQVRFRDNRVIQIIGGRSYPYGGPPPPGVISESELRDGMRFLHPGPADARANDPLHLIRVTNYLQRLGRAKALAIVGEYGRIHQAFMDETWLFLLLRTLFEVPNPPGYMPKMRIGAIGPAPPRDWRAVPRFPIVMIDAIPFSVLLSVFLAGRPESISEHVEYFRKLGMRTAMLRPPDDPFLSFQKLKVSREWKTVINESGMSEEYLQGKVLLQVLALVRTAYDPPEARQPFARLKPSEYDRHHRGFLATGARWDERLQMYVRRDGTHNPVGHLLALKEAEKKKGVRR